MSGKPLWGRAAVATLLMGAWLQGFFLGPLAEEAVDMVRQELGRRGNGLVDCTLAGATDVLYLLLTNFVFNLVFVSISGN